MTKDEAIAAVQAQLNDFSDTMKDRIEAAFPIGASIFVTEYQWEFMDRYTTTTAALDATSSKYKIASPDGFFKPVVLWISERTEEVEWIDRYEWAQRQSGTQTAGVPQAYTLIGEDMFLDRPHNGETIYIIYTKNGDNVNFDKVPGQYHPAIVMAIAMWLTPSTVDDGQGNKLPNPAYNAAERRYYRYVNRAVGMETSNKGRPRRKQPTEAQKIRSSFSR